MNIVRKQPPDTNHKYVFEKDKGIFVITSEMLVSLDRVALDKTKAYWVNIPMGLFVYAKHNKYTVILITKEGDIRFLHNPNKWGKFDIDIEFYKFIKNNYDKI